MFGWFKKKPATEAPKHPGIPDSVEHAREILAETFETQRLERKDPTR